MKTAKKCIAGGNGTNFKNGREAIEWNDTCETAKDAGFNAEEALTDAQSKVAELETTKPDGSDWRIGLRDPSGESYLGVLSVSGRGVVTSGNYERYFTGADGKRYGHILDPVSGYPAENGDVKVKLITETADRKGE